MTKQSKIELIDHMGSDRSVLVEENNKDIRYTVSREVHEVFLE